MPLTIDIITLAPTMWECMDSGVIGRAKRAGLWTQNIWHLRDFATRADKRVDDRAYGGGPGMVIASPPLRQCLDHVIAQHETKPVVIQMDPAGQPLTAALAQQLAQHSALVVLCGRYEGIDARITETYVDQSVSIGPYVLSAGDLPGMCLVDATVRLLPDVLGNALSAVQDSFADDLLDTPHYTRPESDMTGSVPPVLTGGNHADILRWRRKMALGRTWSEQPQLLRGRSLSDEDIQLLQAYIQENSHL